LIFTIDFVDKQIEVEIKFYMLSGITKLGHLVSLKMKSNTVKKI